MEAFARQSPSITDTDNKEQCVAQADKSPSRKRSRVAVNGLAHKPLIDGLTIRSCCFEANVNNHCVTAIFYSHCNVLPYPRSDMS
jgi:hypothetical protein